MLTRLFRNVPRPKVAIAATIASLMKEVPVARASLEDINKALAINLAVTIDSI